MLVVFRVFVELVGDMLGRAILSLRMMSSCKTWVCTLVVAIHEFAFHSWQTVRMFPGVGGFLAVYYILFEVISQSFLETVHDPPLEIQN